MKAAAASSTSMAPEAGSAVPQLESPLARAAPRRLWAMALTESAVSTFEDELGWKRHKSTLLIGAIMLALGSLSALGYGPLSGVTVLGMQFLDLFDFLTNSVMMPIAAIATCLLISKVVGTKKIEEEVLLENGTFRRKRIFNFMIRYLCPIFAAIILISSVANAFGWISM